jgi:transcriptional antiterminator NusG
MNYKWYILQVLTSREKKAKKTIEENLEKMGMKDFIQEILLPTENVLDIKKGDQKVLEKLIWPGYLLVKMILTDESWHFIKETNGVVDFLGGGAPTPLSDKEVEDILNDLRKKKEEVVHKHDIRAGDPVKIIDGVFVNFAGTVTEVFQEKGRLSVLVSIFGRDTRVDDLEFWQVEKNAVE